MIETPEKIIKELSKEDIRRILPRFKVGEGKNFTCHRLYGGIRNAVMLLKFPKEKYVLTVYKIALDDEERALRNFSIYEFLQTSSIPVPEVIKTQDGALLTKETILGAKRVVTMHRFLGGRKFFPYGKEQISAAASMLAQIHTELENFPERKILRHLEGNKLGGTQTGLHMDFARGNVLFDQEGRKVCAVLDFEEAAWGCPISDIAKSLAIIL